MTRFYGCFLNGRSRKGSASALIVLLLVLLVFFGVLSIVTAAADNRLADRRAKWVQSFYAADRAAIDVLAELRKSADTRPASTDVDSLKAIFEQSLKDRPGIEILSSISAGQQVSLLIRVQSGAQGIEAGATFALPETAGGPVMLTIERWTSWQEPFDYENTGGGIWKG